MSEPDIQIGSPVTRRPRRRNNGVLIALIAATLAVPAAVVAALMLRGGVLEPAGDARPSASPSQAAVVNGRVFVIDEEMNTRGATCTTVGGYGDIHEGADVIVKLPNGEPVALGHLDKGRSDASIHACIFDFRVQGVPLGPQFYILKIGNRDAVNVEATKVTGNSMIDLTLGGD